ncbi:MAG: hypothetical protein QOF92_1754, partial [Pseudonocardiales bacterium]|nr:hypothetical protein [Pseudonocardiales bacterium]
VYVTYAKQDSAGHDDVAGPGDGFVDAFTNYGALVKRLVTRGLLNSPWGPDDRTGELRGVLRRSARR